jgi:lipopolysaccharide/colanic/teichoic acid biosynthesis glycosyltransferase
MAARCAVLAVAPREADVARVVLEHACGKVVAPGDVDGLVLALEAFATDDRVLETCRAAAIEAMERDYDMAALAKRWHELVAAVTRSGGSRGAYETLKRGLDLSAGAVGLLAASPLLAGAAAAIRLTMGSPVLFRQQRPGKDGRPFDLVKFRTMRARRPGEVGAEADAERITPVGRFLRRTSLDELPTLWNVVKGDMSLVGPRPLLMRYLDRYTPGQARRHEVKPGVTGWAQVKGRNALSWEEKFEHDVWYVDHRSLWVDLQILFRTALSVLRREGISQEGHATMPEFMGSRPKAPRRPSTSASDDT